MSFFLYLILVSIKIKQSQSSSNSPGYHQQWYQNTKCSCLTKNYYKENYRNYLDRIKQILFFLVGFPQQKKKSSKNCSVIFWKKVRRESGAHFSFVNSCNTLFNAEYCFALAVLPTVFSFFVYFFSRNHASNELIIVGTYFENISYEGSD